MIKEQKTHDLIDDEEMIKRWFLILMTLFENHEHDK